MEKLQDVIQELCNFDSQNVRGRVDFENGRPLIMLMRRLDKARIGGRVVKRLVAEVQQQEFFDQIYVIDKLQEICDAVETLAVSLSVASTPSKAANRQAKASSAIALEDPRLEQLRSAMQAMVLLAQIPQRQPARSHPKVDEPMFAAMKHNNWALQHQLVKVAGASIVAVLRCLPPEVPPGLDPTASKDFMAPVVNLSALLAQSVILLRLALAWSPRGVALGRLEGDDSELWEVVTRGILQAERDRGCAGMCRGILQAVSRLLALGKAAIEVENKAGKWTRFIAKNVRGSIEFIMSAIAVPSFYEVIVTPQGSDGASSVILEAMENAMELHEAAVMQDHLDTTFLRGERKEHVIRDNGEVELCCADVMALFQTAVGHDEPQAHFLDYVFERHPEQAKRTFHKAWLCAGRVFTRGLGAMEMTEDGLRTGWAKRYAGWQEQGAWQSRVPGSGQMDLNMLRVADNMGNDGNTREEGMVLMAPVLVQAWCGPPYAVRSTTCCGMGGLALHSMDIEPVLSPTYTMLRIWDEVVKTARSLWGPTDDIELGLARASCVERCILSLQVVGDLQSFYVETVPQKLKGYFIKHIIQEIQALIDAKEAHHRDEAEERAEEAARGRRKSGQTPRKRKKTKLTVEGGEEEGDQKAWDWSTAHPAAVFALNGWQVARAGREIQKHVPSVEPPLVSEMQKHVGERHPRAVTNEEVHLVLEVVNGVLNAFPDAKAECDVHGILAKLESVEKDELDHEHGIVLRAPEEKTEAPSGVFEIEGTMKMAQDRGGTGKGKAGSETVKCRVACGGPEGDEGFGIGEMAPAFEDEEGEDGEGEGEGGERPGEGGGGEDSSAGGDSEGAPGQG